VPLIRFRLGVIALVLLLLPGCFFDEWKIKRQIESTRQASSGQLQKTRALLLAEESLNALDRVDIALFLPATELHRFYDLLVDSLNCDNDIAAWGTTFDSPEILLTSQTISARVHFSKQFDYGEITGFLDADGFVGSSNGLIVFNVRANQASLESVKLNSVVIFNNGRVVDEINHFLDELIPAANVALDAGLNRVAKNALVARLDQKTLLNKNLEDLNRGTVVTKDGKPVLKDGKVIKKPTLTFGGKVIRTALSVEASSALIETKGILLAAKVKFLDPEEMGKKKFPSLPIEEKVLQVDEKQVAQRISKYQSLLRERVVSALGDDFKSGGDKEAIAAFTSEAASRAIKPRCRRRSCSINLQRVRPI
jgi:hypothetical protein